jgi:oligosaccharide 4-alpha-D-glucosyltransferase
MNINRTLLRVSLLFAGYIFLSAGQVQSESPVSLHHGRVAEDIFAFHSDNGKLSEGIVSTETPAAGSRKLIKIDELTNGWKVKTDNGTIFIIPYSASIVEVLFSSTDEEPSDSSNAVILKPADIVKKITVNQGHQLLESGDLKILAHENPFFLTFIYKDDTILKEASGFDVGPGKSSVSFKLKPAEAIYGTGERAIPLNRRGYKLPLYNRPAYGYQLGATSLNYSIPLILSSEKYAVLWDNPQAGFVDIGKTRPDVLEWDAMGGTARYFVIAAQTYPELLNSYTALTGRQSIPPRWVFGNLMSRMAYRNQKEADSIVTLMQKDNFPIDAIILDFYWFGDSIKGYVGNLDWYKKGWPDPIGMINKFRGAGIKTILITEPYVLDTLKNYKDGTDKKIFVTDTLGRPFLDTLFYFGHGSLIDIFKPEACEWFWQKYQKQINNGIAAWWGDLGEPESHPSGICHVNGKANEVHNIYGHFWDKLLFEKYAENYPHTRLFHLQRSGFAGSQRYSAFPWTGDVSRSWSGLQAQLPLLLTMSLNGLSYIHSDAGGFAMGEKDDELYTRWLQFAVFTPIFRPHGSNIPSEPVFWSEKTRNIIRNYMNLRYAFLPYNYTLAWQNATTGEPLMRALFYSYPGDTIAARIGDEYLWGNNMLVAPVIIKGQTVRKIYFPGGRWIDFYNGNVYKGMQWIDYPVTLERIPIFVRSGSFIPMTAPLTTTDNYKSDNFIVRYYPEGKSEFTQYEDDGLDNLALKEGKFELIRYSGYQNNTSTVINLSKTGNWNGMPPSRSMCFEVRRGTIPSIIKINGKEIESGIPLDKSKSYYQSVEGWLKINLIWKGEPVKIEIIDLK